MIRSQHGFDVCSSPSTRLSAPHGDGWVSPRPGAAAASLPSPSTSPVGRARRCVTPSSGSSNAQFWWRSERSRVTSPRTVWWRGVSTSEASAGLASSDWIVRC